MRRTAGTSRAPSNQHPFVRFLGEGAIALIATFTIAALQSDGITGQALGRVLFALVLIIGCARIAIVPDLRKNKPLKWGLCVAWSLCILAFGLVTDLYSTKRIRGPQPPAGPKHLSFISGTVVDQESNRLLAGVRVSTNQSDVATDSQGLFTLHVSLVEGDSITLHFKKQGYRESDQTVIVPADVRFTLEKVDEQSKDE